MALYYGEDITSHILGRDEPGLAITVPYSANPQSLSLANGVIHQTGVLAHDGAIRSSYFSRLVRQITVEKFPERPFANKTNTSTVFLGKIW